MLQHVTLEVAPDDIAAATGFWELLGFAEIEAPEVLGGYVTWLERGGTHIHLLHTVEPTVPPIGHAAVVVEDFEAAFAALEEAGHEPERHRELWGAPRAVAKMPGGHLVELMASPPAR